jgi:hypothetical protein
MLERIGADYLEEDSLMVCQPVAEDAAPFAVEQGLPVLAKGGGWLKGGRLRVTKHVRWHWLRRRRSH